MRNHLILGVDPQDTFMKPDGALYVQGAENLIYNMELIKVTSRQYQVKHLFTSDGHLENDEELSDNPDYQHTFPPHAMIELDQDGKTILSHAHGFRIDDRIADWTGLFNQKKYIARGEYTQKEFNDIVHNSRRFIIVKSVFNVFEGNQYTDRIFKELKPDVVFVYGVTSDICVDQAVRGLLERNYPVVVIEDAIKELNSKECLADWKSKGVEFIKTHQLVDELKR